MWKLWKHNATVCLAYAFNCANNLYVITSSVFKIVVFVGCVKEYSSEIYVDRVSVLLSYID